eukprot:765719-Hanusia_phi.AAC.4
MIWTRTQIPVQFQDVVEIDDVFAFQDKLYVKISSSEDFIIFVSGSCNQTEWNQNAWDVWFKGTQDIDTLNSVLSQSAAIQTAVNSLTFHGMSSSTSVISLC